MFFSVAELEFQNKMTIQGIASIFGPVLMASDKVSLLNNVQRAIWNEDD